MKTDESITKYTTKKKHNPTLLVAHLHFPTAQSQTKNAKELPSQRSTERPKRATTDNKGLAKWRVKCKIQGQ